MGVCDEDILDNVFFLRAHTDNAPAAAPLPPVRINRHTFDVAGVRDRDDHIF